MGLLARIAASAAFATVLASFAIAGAGGDGGVPKPPGAELAQIELAQKKQEPPRDKAKAKVLPDDQGSQPAEPAAAPPVVTGVVPSEKVEADVSTRAIAVTSAFTGTEIIVFGSVDNSRQPSAESGYYDVAVVVEGAPTPLVARKKTNVAGLWINTEAAAFDRVPSYYAIAATRPIEEIAEATVLEESEIGFDFVRMMPDQKTYRSLATAELEDYRAAVVRLKQKDRLYVRKDYGVVFIGRSLFRSSIALPANVPVGTLNARVYLFHDGKMISRFTTRVNLERQGLELLLYDFAGEHPLLYGIFSVVVALAAGLLASALFSRTTA